MESWKDFRAKCEIESIAKQEIVRELFDWVDYKKRDIVKHEPPDKISYGELKTLDVLYPCIAVWEIQYDGDGPDMLEYELVYPDDFEL